MKELYNLISNSEAAFRIPIPITDAWDWSFFDHVDTSVLYKNSVYTTGKTNAKPFKNITRPILNLQYRAEGFDVKDIVIYVDDAEQNWKSFFIRKYHEVWARENKIDDFIDKMVESFVDFGGALVKKTNDSIPEVVPLQRLAFCDQADLLSGPICEKHFYSPGELREKAKKNGWKNVDDAIFYSEEVRDSGRRVVKTPGKYIEIYEVHGQFPRRFLFDTNEKGEYGGEYYEKDAPENEPIQQVHICVLYKDEHGETQGTLLFKGKEKNPYKLVLRDKIYGRALGLGGGEELFQAQIWTNYGMIRMKQLLDAASKVLYKTTDPKFANRNKTDNLDSGEILVLDENKDIGQIDTTPRSTQLFDNFVAEWEQHARIMGAATESIQGIQPPAGTPFKLQELITAEAHSLHEYRKSKLARFVEEIYREWIIPQIIKDIQKGKEFATELDLDELQFVATRLADNLANRAIKDGIMRGLLIPAEMVEEFKARVRQNFSEGNKKFLALLEGEFKNTDVNVKVSIAGKQKDLAAKTDKLVNVLRFMLQTYDPNTGQFSVFNDPRMAKLFSQIIESSGLDPINLSAPMIAQGKTPSAEATRSLEKLPQRPNVTESVANL